MATHQPIGRRSPLRSRSPTRSSGNGSVAASVATSSSVASEQPQAADARLCGDLSRFIDHGKATVKMKKRAHRVCAVCGKPCHHICTLCKDTKHKDGAPLHKPPSLESEPTCFHQCHTTLFRGLAKTDADLTGTKRKDHCCPTDQAIANHGLTIKRPRTNCVATNKQSRQ